MSTVEIMEAPSPNIYRRLVVQSAGGPFLDGWLLTIIGSAMVGIGHSLEPSTTESALIGVAALVGLFFGGLVFGYVTDKVGRKAMYTIDLLVLIVASILSAFVTDARLLIVLRFIIGVAVGADYPIATAFLTEWLPTKGRAARLGELFVWWYVGATVAAIVGLAINAYGGSQSWRWVLASAAVPGLFFLLLRRDSHESPRWLINRGRVEEAEAVIKSVLGRHATLASLDASGATPVSKSGEHSLLGRPYLARAVFCGGFWFCCVTPIFAMYTFGPVVLGAFHMGAGIWVDVGYALISFMFLVGTIPALLFVERVGRRPTLLWSFGLSALPFVVLGLFANLRPAAVVVTFIAYAFFIGAPGVLVWVYPNEIFPTEIRATAMGVATAISRVGAAIGTYMVPFSLKQFGLQSTMLIAAAITAIGFLISFAMAPETMGKSLDEASA